MSLLHEYYSESVAKHGDQCALEVNRKQYTYSELHAVVNRIVIAIQKRRFHNQAIVVFNEHTIDSYAAILAITLSGNAVLPIELSWPKQRIEDVLKAAKPAGILMDGLNEEKRQNILSINEVQKSCVVDTLSEKPVRVITPDDKVAQYPGIAYIIFTSGSTGVPKGVPVKLTGLDALLRFYKEEYDFNASDRFLQVYEITFDVAYFSFLVPLCCGACCCVLGNKKGVPKYLSVLNDLATRNITVVSMVPSLLPFLRKYITLEPLLGLRYSFFSGDALYHSDALEWKKFVSNASIHNFYGPTETTIVCTRYEWNENDAAKELHHNVVPLGKPFPEMKYEIVDENNQALKKGEVGELAFAGVQVIDHYLNDEHSDKFYTVGDSNNREQYYKTGDLASLNSFGNLVFHGRKDHQVKLNGYRVELEEVQLAIQKLTGAPCVVVKKKNISEIDYLKAFICREGQNIYDLKAVLSDILPQYMIPTEFEFIDQIPLSENGKINKIYLQSL